jgi:hypothetical protein
MHQAEDVAEKVRIVRVLLELDQFDIENRQALVRLG